MPATDYKGVIGETSFTPQGDLKHGAISVFTYKSGKKALLENYAAALDEVVRLKPAAAKGRYLKKITFTTTMGPGIPVDPNKVKPESE